MSDYYGTPNVKDVYEKLRRMERIQELSERFFEPLDA